MVRYLVAAAAMIAVVGGTAVAEPYGAVEKTIKRSDHGAVISKRYMNHRGEMVTKRKVITHGIAGSSVSRSRTACSTCAR